jgi:hypothetical protein
MTRTARIGAAFVASLVAAGLMQQAGMAAAQIASFVDLYFILPGMVAVAVLWLLLRNMRRSVS